MTEQIAQIEFPREEDVMHDDQEDSPTEETPLVEIKEQLKQCRVCKVEKPLSAFGKEQRGKYGVKSICNEPCRSMQNQKVHKKKTAVVKEAKAINKKGLRQDIRDAMIETRASIIDCNKNIHDYELKRVKLQAQFLSLKHRLEDECDSSDIAVPL